MIIVANPDPLFLLKVTELSKQIRKQLWNLLHTAESINILWVNTFARKLNVITIRNYESIQLPIYAKSYTNDYESYFNHPCFVKKDNEWVLGNIIKLQNNKTVAFLGFVLSTTPVGVIGSIQMDRPMTACEEAIYTNIIRWDIITTPIIMKWRLLDLRIMTNHIKELY
jgi:hypothetical protein